MHAKASPALTPQVIWATAHDVSPTLRDMAQTRIAPDADDPADEPDRGPSCGETTAGIRATARCSRRCCPPTIPSTSQNFEGSATRTTSTSSAAA